MKCMVENCPADAEPGVAGVGRMGDVEIDLYVCSKHLDVLRHDALWHVSPVLRPTPARPAADA